MSEPQEGALITGSGFPFELSDLVSWTVRRKDGTVTMFRLTDFGKEVGAASSEAVHYPARTEVHLSQYCSHFPKGKEYFKGDDGLILAIGDYSGARSDHDEFDFVIDCGDVLDLKKQAPTKLLTGDPELVEKLEPATVETNLDTRVLKIDWWDRRAPDLLPQFWTELNKLIYGKVMTCCVGGHGRSGTSFVCLLLNNAPDYDALDAIIHLRAVHCPRAIESVVQHEYINDVARHLGREPNAREATTIKDYKAAFKASTKLTAVKTRERLGW